MSSRDQLVVQQATESSGEEGSVESYSEGDSDEDLDAKFAQGSSDSDNDDASDAAEPDTVKPVEQEDNANKVVDFTGVDQELLKARLAQRKYVKKVPVVLSKAEKKERAQRTKESEELALVRPDITVDRTKEKELLQIATRGVVQLFNAVKARQQTKQTAVEGEWGQRLAQRRLNSERHFEASLMKGTVRKPNKAHGLKTDSDMKDEKPDVTENGERGCWGALADDFISRRAEAETKEEKEHANTRKPIATSRKRKQTLSDSSDLSD